MARHLTFQWNTAILIVYRYKITFRVSMTYWTYQINRTLKSSLNIKWGLILFLQNNMETWHKMKFNQCWMPINWVSRNITYHIVFTTLKFVLYKMQLLQLNNRLRVSIDDCKKDLTILRSNRKPDQPPSI